MRVLVLTHRLPYAPNRGDRIRAFHMIRTLAPRVDLELFSLVHDRDEEARADTLRDLGVRVSTFRTSVARSLYKGPLCLALRRPMTHALLDAPGIEAALRQAAIERPPDVILAYCSGVAPLALRPPLAARPLVIDLVDVDSEKWAALAQTTRGPKGWIFAREARRLAEFERRAARKSRAVLVVTEREAAALRRLSPDARIRVVPNGIDTSAFEPQTGPAEEPRVVFCGVMNYQPNVDAAVWFCRHAWPTIVARKPEARLTLVGSSPTAAVQRLAAQNATITVTGAVADVRPFLWSAAVSVAPLLTARGIQNKVLEAVAARLPVVVTSPVFDGLPLEVHPACLLANDPKGFGDRVLDLLGQSGASRRAIADSASLHTLTWERQLAPLLDILKDAAFGTARYGSDIVERNGGAPAHRLADANGVEPG